MWLMAFYKWFYLIAYLARKHTWLTKLEQTNKQPNKQQQQPQIRFKQCCYFLTELLLIGLKNQFAKIHNSLLDTSHCTWNLGFIFDEHLTFSDQITSYSKVCYYHVRQLRCIRPYLDSSTACTIGASIVHSKVDCCDCLYYKLSKSQLSRLQQIQNSLAHTVIKAPMSCHITPILRSLHWLIISERFE